MDLNRQQTADAMGITPPTLDRWVRDGCPVKQRGSKGVAWVFWLPDVVRWWGDRQRADGAGKPTDEDEAKRRKLIAEAQLAELELAKARGEVAPLDQVERMVNAAFAAVRAGMRNIPNRVVSQLIGETDERTFKRVLGEEIDNALLSLASASLAEAEGAEDDDDSPEDDDSER